MDVTFQVVHAHQGLSQSEGEGFAIDKADQERPDQTRSLGYRDTIHIPYSDSRMLAGLVDDWLDLAQVLAGRQFRNNPAVLRVSWDLRGDNTRENLRAIRYDGCRGLVATGFDAKN